MSEQRGTCDAWACDKAAVGHRYSGLNVVHLCAKHLPACDVCETPKRPDITGELRCDRCDRAIECMVRDRREDAIAGGESQEDTDKEHGPVEPPYYEVTVRLPLDLYSEAWFDRIADAAGDWAAVSGSVVPGRLTGEDTDMEDER